MKNRYRTRASEAEHNILMNPFHILGLAGVKGGSIQCYACFLGNALKSRYVASENKKADMHTKRLARLSFEMILATGDRLNEHLWAIDGEPRHEEVQCKRMSSFWRPRAAYLYSLVGKNPSLQNNQSGLVASVLLLTIESGSSSFEAHFPAYLSILSTDLATFSYTKLGDLPGRHSS
ncbi:hypothetical protein H5410_023447 [Solanum commersonii]|uniref:Uncharacterized protein n=1 Tax=Solanum commersonii TaxID=4109 RepID=A0A9J5ZK23_SOLCO|nr:hypothetical protein H5410_023447 [Solanum commersonii]